VNSELQRMEEKMLVNYLKITSRLSFGRSDRED